MTGNRSAAAHNLKYWLLVSLLALGLLLVSATESLAAITVVGTPTTIDSKAERMISYRHQEHSWQTADGATHLMVNRGTLTPGTSLTLYTSLDNGQTWALSLTLPNSNRYSSSDGVLVGDDLFLAYSSSSNTLLFSVLHYHSPTRTWSVSQSEAAFASAGVNVINPAIAIDSLGAVWCGFVAQDKVTLDANIRMLQRAPNGPGWVDTGLVFGTTDNLSIERSARPVPLPDGMGMVYTVHEKVFWASRQHGAPLNQPWTTVTLFTSTAADLDPYSSHFSIAADSNDNLHMALADKGKLLYFRYLSQTKVWSGRAITADIKANYCQVSIMRGTDTVALFTNATKGSIRLFESSDAGATFVYTTLFAHQAAPSGSGISYENPRLETPSLAWGPIPLVQQYVEGTTQRLLRFW